MVSSTMDLFTQPVQLVERPPPVARPLELLDRGSVRLEQHLLLLLQQ